MLLLKEDGQDHKNIKVLEDWKTLLIIFAFQLASLTASINVILKALTK